MRKNVLFALMMIALIVLSACSAPARTSESASPPMEAPAGAPAMPEMESSDGGGMDNFAKPGSMVQDMQGQGAERLVIRNANLTIVVDQPGDAMNAIMRMSEGMNGFVVTSNLYKRYTDNGVEVPEATVTVRVPAERLNEALEQVKALVKDRTEDIRNENISGQDVTKEYTDLRSRLTNLEEAEAQLREIMDDALRTEDVLNVHAQLTSIREQIEVIKGQIQYYEEAAAMSSISVTIWASEAVKPLEIGGWEPVGVARDAVQALIDTTQVLASAVIWIVIYVLPIALLIFLPLRLLWWLYRRNRKPSPPKQAPTPPAA